VYRLVAQGEDRHQVCTKQLLGLLRSHERCCCKHRCRNCNGFHSMYECLHQRLADAQHLDLTTSVLS
jgi:hypothetical protein